MKKPLAILDLDETLIFASKEKLNRDPDFEVFGYQVYKRPNLMEFINRLSTNYDLAIWSSAGNDYVESIIVKLKLDTNLKFVWGRNQATQKRQLNNFYETGNEDELYYVKSLKKVKRKGYNLGRILIIDDSPHKSELNYGNAIYPKSYKGNKEDDELLKLVTYLESIKDESNFREIEKRNWRKNTTSNNVYRLGSGLEQMHGNSIYRPIIHRQQAA